MAPIRILQIVPAMELGGMETFIMNVYRHIDRERLQFDFLYHYARPGAYDAEIEALGGNITRLTVREDHNVFKYCRQLDDFFATHPYAVVHGHYSGFGLFYNHYAKKHGVRVRVGHSHNTRTERSLVGFFDFLMSYFFRFGVTHGLACGQAAGAALYGRRGFEVFPNGIEVDRFTFDAARRDAARARLGIGENTVLYGHIGRFTQQKNHDFLLDIFAELARRQPAAHLLLVGDGPLRGEAERRAHTLEIAGRVLFAGLQKDTPPLYGAMDFFLLPSRFEGLPVVLVEAQAAGLPCFVSTAVSTEANIAGGVTFLPLEAGAAAWAAAILGSSANAVFPPARRDDRDALVAAGYDIAATASRLQSLYLRLAAEAGGAP